MFGVMTEKPRTKAAIRQQRYRDRLKARNAAATQNVTPDERNEYGEMLDDPGYVSPPVTPEEKERSVAVLAELSLEP
jgi:hypothetical protein